MATASTQMVLTNATALKDCRLISPDIVVSIIVNPVASSNTDTVSVAVRCLEFTTKPSVAVLLGKPGVRLAQHVHARTQRNTSVFVTGKDMHPTSNETIWIYSRISMNVSNSLLSVQTECATIHLEATTVTARKDLP